jgi:hypothetical protein
VTDDELQQTAERVKERAIPFIVCRCECKPAINLYGANCPESPTLRDGLCAVKRWRVERAVMDSTYARWQAEALNGN